MVYGLFESYLPTPVMINEDSEGLVSFSGVDLFQLSPFIKLVIYWQSYVMVIWVIKWVVTLVIPFEVDRIYELFIWYYGSLSGF